MSKPANNSRRASRSQKFLQRLFPSRQGTADRPARGRQRTSLNSLTPRRRVRLLFFSTWGSDYKQIDFSAKTVVALVGGFIALISLLAILTAHTANRFVQDYRLAALTEDHQILRSRLKQTETRLRNLFQRVDGSAVEEIPGITQQSDSNKVPVFANVPGQDNATSAATNRLAPAGGAKRGPLGLAWTEDQSAINEPENKEQNFFGQGGGAFVDDEDNIYPTQLEHERSHLAQASLSLENPLTSANVAGKSDLLSQLEQNLSQTQAVQRQIMEKFEVRRKQLEHIPSIKPLLSGRVTDFFGKRVDPFVSRVRHHQGLDIGAPNGTEVFAPANGVVEFVKTTYRRKTGYGKAVVINHGYGVKTLYGHLSDVKVKAGQKIERWDIIGLVGETGRATGPHLHYEVWVDGITTDPLRFILNN